MIRENANLAGEREEFRYFLFLILAGKDKAAQTARGVCDVIRVGKLNAPYIKDKELGNFKWIIGNY